MLANGVSQESVAVHGFQGGSGMSPWSLVKWFAAIGIMLLWPVAGYAQEAVVAGTVTDSTGGVLPGVAVTALNEASGNTFESVTDERGDFRIPVRIGTYRITAQLSGFATVARTIEMQVGQTVVVNVQMQPSTLQESVTVTGEAPLISTVSSSVGANIDRRQMESIPLAGRNWMDLALLAPGVRSIESSGVPDSRQGYSQINVDGQQITQLIASTDAQQPKYSKDAIAEFEIVSNRFDASQGRSAGFEVNAITKSGTNTPSGTVSGYFRDDKFNAADKVQHRVVPYQNQQLGVTFGGPIVRDRLHYFANFEYEREPNTLVYTHPLFPRDIPVVRRQKTGLLRVDAQFTSATRLSSRGQYYDEYFYGAGSATAHPGNAAENHRYSSQIQNILTHVISNKSVNSLQVGWSSATRGNRPFNLDWKGGCNPNAPKLTPARCGGSHVVAFTGLTIGSTTGQLLTQEATSIRDDLTTSFNRGGRHDIKFGGEFLDVPVIMKWCTNCLATITLNSNTPPPANIQSIFPVWNDVSTWNYAALSPLTVRVNQAVSRTNFIWYPKTYLVGGWMQDDWHATARMTINLGVRYDLQTGAFSEKVELEPWLPGNLPYDTNNFAPRTGVVYKLSENTVLRGGYGIFYVQMTTDEAQQTLSNTVNAGTEVLNDGRPDFAGNWFNGPNPTFEQALAKGCNVSNVPGCYRTGNSAPEINLKWGQTQPWSHQASVGMEHQIGRAMGLNADVTYTGGRNEENDYNINRTFNAATGDQNNFNTIALRAFPNFGAVTGNLRNQWTNYYSLQTTLNKRMSNRWQGSVNYSYTRAYTGTPAPDQFSFANGVESAATLTRTSVPFPLRFDVGRQYVPQGIAHNRLVGNGIWDAGHGMQLSGVYLYTDGGFSTTSCGCQSGTGLSNRFRLNGTIIPINNFNKKTIHRMDVRFQKRFNLGGHRTLDGTLEIFNLFNHGNFASYTVDESNPLFGRPTFNSNVAYQPRTGQLGFRLAF